MLKMKTERAIAEIVKAVIDAGEAGVQDFTPAINRAISGRRFGPAAGQGMDYFSAGLCKSLEDDPESAALLLYAIASAESGDEIMQALEGMRGPSEAIDFILQNKDEIVGSLLHRSGDRLNTDLWAKIRQRQTRRNR